MDNLCKDCGKRIDPRSIRCTVCSHKGKLNPFYGKKHTDENKKSAVSTRMANGSYTVSEETRKKLSNARKGIPRSEETKKKISIATKGKPSYDTRRENHHNWKGGRYKKSSGYIMVMKKDHPHCNNMGYVPEHRLVMENHLGRFLLPSEVVHHINKDVSDNRIENLELFNNNSEHMKSHYPKSKSI